MMSAMVSSASHSAPSGAMIRLRSAISDSGLAECVTCDLAYCEHADGALVLVHHEPCPPSLLARPRDRLGQLRVLVDEQRRCPQHIACQDGDMLLTDQVTAGQLQVALDEL